ncbi:MAG: hypothetical protein ACOY42_06790 [Pseudomonadota bacterium]
MRAPRRRKPTFSPTITAALTGAPWPDTPSGFDSHKIEHPNSTGLLAHAGTPWTLADAWLQYHGRPMTTDDKRALASRLPELRATVARRFEKPRTNQPTEKRNDKN